MLMSGQISAGLVIGGMSFKEESLRINAMNVLICTPGRLLQHMDETPAFDCSNLQVPSFVLNIAL